MSIFKHFAEIEELRNEIELKEEVISIYEDCGSVEGLGLGGVPWVQNAPWSMDSDFDFDGIPDALDNHMGWGAF